MSNSKEKTISYRDEILTKYNKNKERIFSANYVIVEDDIETEECDNVLLYQKFIHPLK